MNIDLCKTWPNALWVINYDSEFMSQNDNIKKVSDIDLKRKYKLYVVFFSCCQRKLFSNSTIYPLLTVSENKQEILVFLLHFDRELNQQFGYYFVLNFNIWTPDSGANTFLTDWTRPNPVANVQWLVIILDFDLLILNYWLWFQPKSPSMSSESVQVISSKLISNQVLDLVWNSSCYGTPASLVSSQFNWTELGSSRMTKWR